MDKWLEKIGDFFSDLFKEAFEGLIDLLKDFMFWIVEGVLNAIASVLELLPVPDFIQNTDLGQILSPLPSFALFVIGNIHLDQCLALIGGGVAFNLLRKLFTLGQW